MELISVVVPVYNRAEIFGRAIQSIVKQTYPLLQIVVVDDGSSEDVRSVFEKIRILSESEERTFLYIRQENKGAPSARNRGLAEAAGDYVIFWDADIVGKPEMLQEMQGALAYNSDASFVYSNFLFGKKLFRGMPFSFEELKKKNFITTTSLIRTADVTIWDESLKRFQDWDLWLTMSESGKKGLWIDKTLFYIDVKGTMSSWLPSFAYHRLFRWLPGISQKVKKYESAKQTIFNKHHLF